MGGAVEEVWFGPFVMIVGVCAREAVCENVEEFFLREVGVA